MTPVDQIRTGFGRGQCTEACVATLLDVELDQVPDLWAGPGVPDDAPPDDHQPRERRDALWQWLKDQHGVMCLAVAFDAEILIAEAWEHAETFGAFPLGDLAMAGTWTRAKVGHFVVADRSGVVHDPNPAIRAAGSTKTCDLLWFLVPLADVPEAAREMVAAQWSLKLVPA